MKHKTQSRNRSGLAKRLIPLCVTIISEYGPMTADVLGQHLRDLFNLDLTTTELPMMIATYGKNDIYRARIRKRVYPYGVRSVLMYYLPGKLPAVPRPEKPMKPRDLTDGFDDIMGDDTESLI